MCHKETRKISGLCLNCMTVQELQTFKCLKHQVISFNVLLTLVLTILCIHFNPNLYSVRNF